MKNSREIRQTFLSFFQQKQHQIVKSAPIVLKDDPTLMFTNAGMNQFKDIFLGTKSPDFKRCADTQKCLRVSGKHNDLDEVGHDTYHHTMFEMLGNWSFGDYYKTETIAWAWELLTKELGISPDRLYVTVFEGDEKDGVPADGEAAKEWEKWIDPDRVIRAGKKDNFWEMGEVGPSGPSSEIHMDLRSDSKRKKKDGRELVNADHPEVVEIWNLVFIQYNRKADGSLEELPAKHVDTGMGFERLAMALQGKKSTYDTDVFDASRKFLEEMTGIKYSKAGKDRQVAIRVVMDHIRAIAFTIADGQIPSNTGAGYVIRRILRRASRYAYSYLDLQEPFMYKMIALLAEQYKGVFDELEAQQQFIEKIVLEEEKGFLRKLESGMQMFEEYMKANPGTKTVDGAFAFKLYDTYGFPVDLTMLLAREKKAKLEIADFEKHLEEQKNRSRKATEVSAGDWVNVNSSSDLPRFWGYDQLELETRILQYRTTQSKKKKIFHLVLEDTPFYAESGGQVGDRGILTNGVETLNVIDTKKENELIVHVLDKLPQDPTGSWKAIVNPVLRKATSQNHTATHLMHAALREILGTHVEQRGSLVSETALRFDFSHFEKVNDEQIAQIEKLVNEKISAAIPLAEFRDMDIEKAKEMGAMALFGEKYGDSVRVIVFDDDFSIELCGGTHVPNTSEIRLFKIVSEGSVAAGIRRIEAYTADGALEFYNKQLQTLQEIAEMLKSPKDLTKTLNDLVERARKLEKEIQLINAERVKQIKGELLSKAAEVKGIKLIKEVISVSSSDDLKQLSFELKNSLENALIVLGAVINNKPLLSIIMTDDLAKAEKYNAGKMIRELAKEIKGGGGGQAFYATAGGKDPEGLKRAVVGVEKLL